ncbi:hypothetical protein F4802DRAFT_385743 [Xylaria palmicola]|nr:hypothetical protein F4802DRAFT_385743 [Xylaria palmicola]
MASEPKRPPTRTGSGSRPPTSRFQEGSMNDRTSAAPPVQFLDPEKLREFETQFFPEPPRLREACRERPVSASAQLQATMTDRHIGLPEAQQDSQQRTVTHKKSMSFFGRVRDALFHRGGGQHGQFLKHDEVRRKHTSLQEPLQHPPAPPPPPRPDHLRAGRTQSEMTIAQMFPNPTGGADRPTREEVMASYNQLVASGFFQSHAIQSTRHAAPTAAAGGGGGGRQPPILHMDHGLPAHRRPTRVSSIHGTARAGSMPPAPAMRPMLSPSRPCRDSREYMAAPLMPPAAPRSSLSSLFRPSIPDLKTKDSRYTLRGRKRTRGDETPVVSPEPQSPSLGPTSYFTQPLRRVAKKLRQMPSTSSHLNEAGQNQSSAAPTPAGQPVVHQAAADVVVRLVPTVSNDGSLQPNERPIRMRSPSPAVPEMVLAGRGEPRPQRPTYERSTSATRVGRPRKTFSYTLTESPRSRGRTAEPGSGRERERNRLQRRGSSAARANSGTRSPPPNALGPWQRASLQDTTVIHRDSTDSARPPQWDWERREATELLTAVSPGARARMTTTTTTTQSPASSPLRAVPDANRSMPKTPERWHNSGKAYHLKDRGSRRDLTARWSEDNSGGGARPTYGKENSHHSRGHQNAGGDWRHDVVFDADGDVDVLASETSSPSKIYQLPPPPPTPPQQWCIGNAL